MADSSDTYFESYEDLNVHKLMLEDFARNQAYKSAIFENRNCFKNKIILDVGGGTGFLSVLCAQAGASRVYCVEANDVYKIAEEIVKDNNFSEIITVIHSKIEDVYLPEKVDIIISEWMGFYLLHESMLDSVIFARDKFLKSGGLMFPDYATLYSAPCSIPFLFDQWQTNTGINMSAFAKKLRQQLQSQPYIETISPEDILSAPETVCCLDLTTVKIEELSSIQITHKAITKEGKFQGICLWFACDFPGHTQPPVTLGTSPEDITTHWKQTLIVLPAEIEVEENDTVCYELSLNKVEDTRRYEISMELLGTDVEMTELLVKTLLERCGKGDGE